MAECCCVMYPANTSETLIRDAIDTNNQNYFNEQLTMGKQDIIARVKINGEYTILEYAIMRHQKHLVAYFLDDKKWGLVKLKQDPNNLTNIIAEECANANKKNLSDVKDIRDILKVLEAKGIPIETHEFILDAPMIMHNSHCNLI